MSDLSGTIRLRARLSLPMFPGVEVVLVDRNDVSGPSGEVRVTDWGEAACLMDGGEDSCTLTVSNAPLANNYLGAATARFSDYWNQANPPEGAKVVFEVSTSTTPSWSTFFVGAIKQVSSTTERQVVLQIADLGTKFDKSIGDPITTTDFPQCPEESTGKPKPIIFNYVEEFTPVPVRDRKKATLVSQILATEVATTGAPLTKNVNSNKTWPKSGTLSIGDEVFTYDNNLTTSDTVFVFIGRAVGSAAEAHAPGDALIERAKLKWCVSGHPIAEAIGSAITLTGSTVYAVSKDNKLALLTNGTDYTVSNGPDGCFIELVSDQGMRVEFPSNEPRYIRVEADTPSFFPISPVSYPGFLTNSTQAKNAAMACGGANEWGPNTYAVCDKVAHDTLSVYRTNPFTYPGPAPSKVWIGVEHFGIGLFGGFSILSNEMSDDVFSTTVTVENLGKLDDYTSVAGSKLYIDGEVMTVVSLNKSTKTYTVTRGSVDVNNVATTIKKHFVGATVSAYYSTNPLQYFQPDFHVFLETSAGSNIPVEMGTINDETDVPPEIPQNDTTFSEAKTLQAWHGHPLQGLPKAGKTFNAIADLNTATGAYTAPSRVGDMIAATIRTFNVAASQLAIPINSDGLYYLNITGSNAKACYIFTSQPGMNQVMLQRALRIRFRLLYAGDLRLRMWVPAPGGGPFLLLDENFDAGTSYPPTQKSYTKVIDQTSAFPDGLRWQQLLHKETVIMIDRQGNGTGELYNFAVDIDWDDTQLAPNSVEFISNRKALYGTPTLVSNINSVGYTIIDPVSGLPKVTTPPGYPSPPTTAIVELTQGRWHAFLSHSGNTVLGSDGTSDGVINLTTSPSTANQSSGFKVYWQNPSAPGRARVLKAAIILDVGARTGASSINFRLRNSNVEYQPDSDSSGSCTDHAGQANNLVRRVWRAIWNLENKEITVNQFVNDWFWYVTAGGGGNDSCYIDNVNVYLEVDEDRADLVQPEKGDQFTRVKYIDVSNTITDYPQILNRRVEIKMNGVKSLPFPGIIVSKDEQQRAVLFSRVFWVFRVEGTTEEELERIAITTTGIQPFTPLAPTSSLLYQTLTMGAPLMSAANTDTDVNQFAVVGSLEGTGIVPQIAGVIEEQTTATELLRNLCEQMKLSGVWEAGQFRPIFKPDPALMSFPVATFFSGPGGGILEDTLEVERKTKDSVSNFVTVRARKDWINGGFKFTKSYKSALSIAKYGKRVLELDADFIRLETGCDLLAKQLCQYRAEPEVLVRFQTSLYEKAKNLKRGDVIAVTHLLYSSIRLEVLSIAKAMGSIDTGVSVYQIECAERQIVPDVTAA